MTRPLAPPRWRRMLRAVSIASVASCATIVCLQAHAASDPMTTGITRNTHDARRPAGVDIQVADKGWGNARRQDIEAVLYSVAGVLLEHFPGRRLSPIAVSHTPERPITLYRKGPGNSYQVQLSAAGEHWARYAYEFAHEFSHILMNYDHHPDAQTASLNQWFEEALCEAASLYALKRLTMLWEISPPQPRWAAYAPQFERYVERFLNEPHRRLPPDVSLALWFRQHEEDLRGRAYLRNHNEVVANLLLPLFEENASFWAAVGYLNLQPKPGSFGEYLQSWHDSAPEQYRDTIRYIMALFGVLESVTAPQGTTREAQGGAAGMRQPPPDRGVAGPAPHEQR